MWVNREIRVNQAISHPPHQGPGYMRISLMDFFRYLAGCFTNYDKIQLYRPDRFDVCAEGFKIQITGKRLDLRNGIQDILYPFFPAPSRQ